MAQSAFDKRYEEGQARVAQLKREDEAQANKPYVYENKAQRQVNYKIGKANDARDALTKKRELSSDPYRKIDYGYKEKPAAGRVINTSLPAGTPGGPPATGGANGSQSAPRTGGASPRGQMYSGTAGGEILSPTANNHGGGSGNNGPWQPGNGNSYAQNNGGGSHGGGMVNLSNPGQTPGGTGPTWQTGGISQINANGVQAAGVSRPNEASATGYNAAGYSSPDQAQTSGYDVARQAIDPSKTSAGLLASMTQRDSPYMQAARTNALQRMNRSGNLNTSTAVGAAELAAIQAAQPFALNDSGQYFNADRDHANAQNREGEFDASAGNQASMQTNQQQDQSFRFNADSTNVQGRHNSAALNNSSQFNANSFNRASEINANAINRFSEIFVNAKNATDRDTAQNEFKMTLAKMDQELSTYKTDIQRATAIEQMGIHALESGMAQGIFADRELALGYLQTIGTMIPDLGIQIAVQAADAAASSGAIV